ncbi:VanZ family protein [Porticoccus sp. GXU_MW_L64]
MKRIFLPGSIFCRLAFGGSLLLITALSLMPMPDGELRFPHQDKVSHAVAYVYLFVLGWWGWFVTRPRWRLALILLTYGILIELLQGMTGYRSMEWLDLLANITGIGVGWLLVRMFRHCEEP